MSAVMGTMRKMGDSPMDEKMTVAPRSTSSQEARGGCCSSAARKKVLVKRRRRIESRPQNGHCRRRPSFRRQEEEDSDHGQDGDVPMDLSKRTGEEGTSKGQIPEGDSSQGLEQEGEEQPLNLSRNTRVIALRCDSCPNVAAHSSGVSSSASPELLQKRVRLEEMVSYIRRFSVVDNGRHVRAGTSDSNHGDETEEKRNVFGAVKRSHSCSSLLERRKKRPREEEAPGDGTSGGGFVSYPVLRQQLLGVDCRRLGLLQSVASQNYTKDDGEYKEEAEEEEDEEEEEEVSEREDEDSDTLLHHQMRLLSTAVADQSQRFPWSAYAYYNLFQELQGQATLPLSLAVQAPESRGASPLSSEGLMTNTTPTPASADGSTANAMFRKRAPRALTGKHVKHGTGASPATLLTLRQKIQQKLNQKAASPAHARMDRKAEAGRMHKAMKGASASLLGKKKKVS